jgi:hypothetical protein
MDRCHPVGGGHPVDSGHPALLAMRCDAPAAPCWPSPTWARTKVSVDLGRQPGQAGKPLQVFADQAHDAPGEDLDGLTLGGSGHRCIRLRETPGR